MQVAGCHKTIKSIERYTQTKPWHIKHKQNKKQEITIIPIYPNLRHWRVSVNAAWHPFPLVPSML